MPENFCRVRKWVQMTETALLRTRFKDDFWSICSSCFTYRCNTACHRTQGDLNSKRILSLMRLMGLEATYTNRSLSKRNREYEACPYLLRNEPLYDRIRFSEQISPTFVSRRDLSISRPSSNGRLCKNGIRSSSQGISYRRGEP